MDDADFKEINDKINKFKPQVSNLFHVFHKFIFEISILFYRQKVLLVQKCAVIRNLRPLAKSLSATKVWMLLEM